MVFEIVLTAAAVAVVLRSTRLSLDVTWQSLVGRLSMKLRARRPEGHLAREPPPALPKAPRPARPRARRPKR